jgi:uncharacterized protein YjbI with pentapeptide repeats
MVDAADLSDIERQVWEAFPAGTSVDLRAGNTDEDDPARGENWGPDRQVRAEVLVALLCGAVEVEPGQVGAVYLKGACVKGRIALWAPDFKHVLRLVECYIADGIELQEATTRSISLRSCYIGPVNLIDAKINGALSLSGARLNGGDGRALTADGLTVASSMFCDEGFCAEGEVRLVDAIIGGGLNFSGAHLNGKNGPALNASGVTVASMFSGDGFRTEGEVALAGASVRLLSLVGAHLDGKNGAALNADGLTVIEHMLCIDGFRAEGEVGLVGAKVGTLVDKKESWPERLELDGFTYGDLTYLPAQDRLDWLNRSSWGYRPQPYEQLAAYYRRLGHDEQARRVLLAKQRQRTLERPWWARGWGWAQDALVGYGYAPGRALILLAVAFLAGWLVFRSHHPAAVDPAGHPVFNAALYTLDVLIPVPALGQAGDWDPHGTALALAVVMRSLGWLLAITVIAAITRSFTRS